MIHNTLSRFFMFYNFKMLPHRLNYLLSQSLQLRDLSVLIPILQMGKPRLRACVRVAWKKPSDSESIVFFMMYYSVSQRFLFYSHLFHRNLIYSLDSYLQFRFRGLNAGTCVFKQVICWVMTQTLVTSKEVSLFITLIISSLLVVGRLMWPIW